ncbi:teneurin-a [Caerostris extrusa]|uniref:Teneurin-a n=1 Tax=Caerostris extrusa TaxID=172846 RepID=A0AAV4X754_CAEEX|nr:teneurin-a [Caerostris extrusa]
MSKPIFTLLNCSSAVKTTIHQDGVIEVETPWQQELVWESIPHPVLMGNLPVQAGMFPVPLRLTSFEGEDGSTVSSWNYEIKYKDNNITAVERVLAILTVKDERRTETHVLIFRVHRIPCFWGISSWFSPKCIYNYDDDDGQPITIQSNFA